ncbi:MULTISPECIES: hypothetical protein [unclassified Bradyrhizobium]|uniref:hypothetical protein n=1 Tax=unclassified Bradyrhizobium TaxID=2631580 RepID=UPI00247965C9|nr:hypothetical protein [Bradyrhizobium sp. ISRA426]WGR75357.1 hypothetical protein MTX24_33310 [Bradyrhizobium sp. ISRA426]WGR90559.1 hypothetical protein MTX25_32990 [Bradyrhizobium sp. ISRA432]
MLPAASIARLIAGESMALPSPIAPKLRASKTVLAPEVGAAAALVSGEIIAHPIDAAALLASVRNSLRKRSMSRLAERGMAEAHHFVRTMEWRKR